MMREPFPCNGCGACCKSIRLSAQTAGLDRGDGVCRHYDEQRKECGIYDHRPEVCNVERLYETQYASRLDWPLFVALNLQACAGLQARQEEGQGR